MGLNTRPARLYERGLAIIELALLIVFLLLLFIGITEIGRAFWYYSAVQKAAREGARCLSMVKWDSTAASDASQCITITVDDANNAEVSPPLASGDVTMLCDGGSCGAWGAGGATAAPEYIGIRIQHQVQMFWHGRYELYGPQQFLTYHVSAVMPFMK